MFVSLMPLFPISFPKYVEAYTNRGFTHGELGDHRQAIEDLQMAAKLDNEEEKNLLKSQGINW